MSKTDKTEVHSLNIQLTEDQYQYLQQSVNLRLFSSKIDVIRLSLREYIAQHPLPS
jgi:Arc/MetJ-type ribon-helix-helix transcriptional regulator